MRFDVLKFVPPSSEYKLGRPRNGCPPKQGEVLKLTAQIANCASRFLEFVPPTSAVKLDYKFGRERGKGNLVMTSPTNAS